MDGQEQERVLQTISKSVEALRREIAAANSKLDRRGDRIASFCEQRHAAAAKLSQTAVERREELYAMGVTSEDDSLLASERERLQARVASRDAAKKDHQTTKAQAALLHATMDEAQHRVTAAARMLESRPAAMQDWFLAPAARASLSMSPLDGAV
jgi:multidrug resistance efflux pump